jgi:hypothetical protein
MTTDAAAIFTAALGLPESLRADLAAQLIGSLEDFLPEPNRTPEEWVAIINDRCDAIDRGDAELIDGEDAIAMLDAVIERASRKS